jgi:hypothetical protein
LVNIGCSPWKNEDIREGKRVLFDVPEKVTVSHPELKMEDMDLLINAEVAFYEVKYHLEYEGIRDEELGDKVSKENIPRIFRTKEEKVVCEEQANKDITLGSQ